MPEHMTDAHFSFTFVFKQALNHRSDLGGSRLRLDLRESRQPVSLHKSHHVDASSMVIMTQTPSVIVVRHG